MLLLIYMEQKHGNPISTPHEKKLRLTTLSCICNPLCICNADLHPQFVVHPQRRTASAIPRASATPTCIQNLKLHSQPRAASALFVKLQPGAYIMDLLECSCNAERMSWFLHPFVYVSICRLCIWDDEWVHLPPQLWVRSTPKWKRLAHSSCEYPTPVVHPPRVHLLQSSKQGRWVEGRGLMWHVHVVVIHCRCRAAWSWSSWSWSCGHGHCCCLVMVAIICRLRLHGPSSLICIARGWM